MGLESLAEPTFVSKISHRPTVEALYGTPSLHARAPTKALPRTVAALTNVFLPYFPQETRRNTTSWRVDLRKPPEHIATEGMLQESPELRPNPAAKDTATQNTAISSINSRTPNRLTCRRPRRGTPRRSLRRRSTCGPLSGCTRPRTCSPQEQGAPRGHPASCSWQCTQTLHTETAKASLTSAQDSRLIKKSCARRHYTMWHRGESRHVIDYCTFSKDVFKKSTLECLQAVTDGMTLRHALEVQGLPKHWGRPLNWPSRLPWPCQTCQSGQRDRRKSSSSRMF
jgi:hypothetical protein